MPRVTVDYDFTETELAAVHLLRGSVPLQEFLREATQLGIVDFREDAQRLIKNRLFEGMSVKTKGYQKQAEAQFIDEPAKLEGRARKLLDEPA